ncbi:autoinducer binding domain-containing protein [Falsirhodobacter halotolerans]|uniref:autoinducer binding domain-containing protein n=1 Tax=Falsirhodobacter halotolerans TaxID=1146892 RepID=UPI001FD09F1A|nr:autoinducer binding domain-containing protein [Falsirhodobacter halotolerans]MCJ8138546.1 autoinducer binding domain-containing protein [Falsirhodobacter halotolerans]
MGAASPITEELDRLSHLPNRGYAFALHIRTGRPTVLISTFSDAWMRYYDAMGFFLRDPCIGWACTANGAQRWSDPRVIDPHGVLREAATFGMPYGAMAAQGDTASLSVGAISRVEGEFTDDELAEFYSILRAIHLRMAPLERLTPAQVQALRIISTGTRYAAAAEQLGISESALKARLHTARARLMARTTPDAIRRAKDYGLI